MSVLSSTSWLLLSPSLHAPATSVVQCCRPACVSAICYSAELVQTFYLHFWLLRWSVLIFFLWKLFPLIICICSVLPSACNISKNVGAESVYRHFKMHYIWCTQFEPIPLFFSPVHWSWSSGSIAIDHSIDWGSTVQAPFVCDQSTFDLYKAALK